jgi:hypothetical protein
LDLLQNGTLHSRRKTLEISLMSVALTSPDIALVVLQQRANATRGWCRELAAAAEVCTVWREALATLRMQLAEWHELTWRIEGVSKLTKRLTEGMRLAPTSGTSGAYDWQLLLVARPLNYMAMDETMWALWDNSMWEDVEAGSVVHTLGVFLEIPRIEELPDSWTRRTECVLTLHHAFDPSKSRIKYFRHHYQDGETDWGMPDGLGPVENPAELRLEELVRPRAGFVGETDTLSITARVRVTAGRLICTPERVAHPLLEPDGLVEHVERVPGLTFYCDLCGLTLPTRVLHRCCLGCNFDVCDACIDPTIHLVVSEI